MGVYDRQIATAKRLITKFGQSVTWQQITDGAPGDSSKPWKPGAATTVENTVDIVFLPEDRRDYEFLRALSGTSIPTGNLVGYMAATTFTPTLKDTVLRGTEKLGVKSIDPIAPNGEILLYIVRFEL